MTQTGKRRGRRRVDINAMLAIIGILALVWLIFWWYGQNI